MEIAYLLGGEPDVRAGSGSQQGFGSPVSVHKAGQSFGGLGAHAHAALVRVQVEAPEARLHLLLGRQDEALHTAAASARSLVVSWSVRIVNGNALFVGLISCRAATLNRIGSASAAWRAGRSPAQCSNLSMLEEIVFGSWLWILSLLISLRKLARWVEAPEIRLHLLLGRQAKALHCVGSHAHLRRLHLSTSRSCADRCTAG